MSKSELDDVRILELPVPPSARAPGKVGQHTYKVVGNEFSVGIMYARELFGPNEELGIHISISYVANSWPRPVTDAVLRLVEAVVKKQSLRWPTSYDIQPFGNGPFAGLGIHLWEKHAYND